MRRCAALLSVTMMVSWLIGPAHGAGSDEAKDFMTRLREATAAPKEKGETPTAAEAATRRTNAGGDELMERIWCGDVTDGATRELCWKSYQARMNYYIEAMSHRSRVFWWQHMASRVIFIVVIGLVSVGVYFAWVQFRKDLVARTSDSATQLELATSGLKVSSPVLGVVILVVSLAFFYLYLTHVFPILETF